MEDSWIFIDDDNSSVHSLTDSDKIDSETEAELYSKIHHEDNLFLNEKPSELLVYSPLKNDIFCIDKGKNASTPMKLTNEHSNSNESTCDNFSNGKRKSSEMDANCKKSNTQKKLRSHCMKDLSSLSVDSNDSKNTIANSVSKNNCNRKNYTMLLDSSDSDSIFCIEPSSEENDLKINVLNDTETVLLSSSDSDNEEEDKFPVLKRNSILKNLSMPNMKIEENSKDLWYINYEDLRRSKKHSRRYHDNVNVTCSNCNRKGHFSKSCPSPRVIKCFVCGGNHLGSRCSNRMCSNCYRSGHDRRNCHIKRKKKVCYLCNMEGHTKGNCPDLWRRYHLTTKPFVLKTGQKFKQYANLYCWNCGKRGHFGGVCPLLHLSNNNFSTWPCVVSYDNPKHLLKERLSVLKNAPPINAVKQSNQLNITPSVSEEKNLHYKVKNELNVSSGSNEENRKNKKKKNKGKTALRFNKVQDAINGKDFPRTPKKNSSIKRPKKFNKIKNEPESVQLLMKNQLDELKRQWKTQVCTGKGASLPFSDPQKRVSNIHCEDNLPQSIKLQVVKKFNNWKFGQMKRLRMLKRNITKRAYELCAQD